MKKIISSFYVEIFLLFRSNWTYVFFAISILLVALHFHVRLDLHDPGNTLNASAFIVQGGIFVSLLFGVQLTTAEKLTDSDEVFETIENGYLSKTIGKICVVSFSIIIFNFVSLIVLYVMYWKHGVPAIFYREAVPYVILYWGLPFFIAAVIGMFLRLVIKNKMIYPIIVLVSVIIGPMNHELLISFTTPLNLRVDNILFFLNLGQSDPHAPFNPVYGFPLESFRWKFKVLFALTILLLLIIQILKRFYRLSVLITIISVLALLAPITLMINIYNQQKGSLTFKEVNSYDVDYYTKHQKINFENETEFSVKSYDIQFTAGDILDIDVELTVSPIEDSKEFIFTLYHQLKVTDIKTKNIALNYEQQGDFIKVNLSESVKKDTDLTLHIKYRGKSSPLFIANKYAVMLPGFFPWLPLPNSREVMKIDSVGTTFLSNLQKNPVNFTLKYSGPGQLFTNLDHTGSNIWSGNSLGVTLVSGWLKGADVDTNTQIITPKSLYNMNKSIPEFLIQINDITKDVQTTLNLESSTNKKSFFLSIPSSHAYPSNIWNLKDHTIIGVDQMYNNGDLLTLINWNVPAVLTSLTRTDNWTSQTLDMRKIFIDSYSYWYGLVHKTDKQKGSTFLEIDLSIYKQANLNHETLLVERILNLIQSDPNSSGISKYFLEWYELMDRKQQTTILEILDLTEKYMKGSSNNG